MELLIVVLIVLLITIFVLLAKASAVKRSVDNLLARVSSVENDLRNLRQQTGPAVKPEAPATAPRREGVPPPLPVTTPGPVVAEKNPEPSPVPQRNAESKPTPAAPAKPPIDWEQFLGAKLFPWIGGPPALSGVGVFLKCPCSTNLAPPVA